MSAATSSSARAPEPCWLCHEPTRTRALYTPTDVNCERVYWPGVFPFPLCLDCAPQLLVATPASVALVAELRALALGGVRGLV